MGDQYEELFNMLAHDLAKMICTPVPSQPQVEMAKGWLRQEGYGPVGLEGLLEDRKTLVMLLKYGMHQAGCRTLGPCKVGSPSPECDCGWEDVSARMRIKHERILCANG